MQTKITFGLAGAFAGILAVTSPGFSHALAPAGGLKSGVRVGDHLSAFEPTHVTGADKGSNTCPVCKYPNSPAVQVWINSDDDKNIAGLVETLERSVSANANKKMKAFVIFINPTDRPDSVLKKRLETIAASTKVQNVALAYLSGPRHEAVKQYQINSDPKVKNTVFVYRNRAVSTKFVNLVADKAGLEDLNSAIKKVLN